MTILIDVLLGIWTLVALLMMLVILMQRPKSEGLGAAFGGAVTENLFGAQTTNVLVKFTGWLAGIFFVVTFVLSILYAHKSMAGSSLSRELKKTAAQSQASPAAKVVTPAGAVASPAQGTSPAAGLTPAVASSIAASPSPAAAGKPSANSSPAKQPGKK